MEWILLALIIGASFYIGKILLEFSEVSQKIQPRIEDMDIRAREAAERTYSEEERMVEIQNRLPALLRTIKDLEEHTTELRGMVEKQVLVHNRLELATMKYKIHKGR